LAETNARAHPDALYRCPLFAGIEPASVDVLMSCARPAPRNARKGDPLCLEGDRQDGIGILLEGTAQVVRETATGTRSVLGMLEPGDLFGEMTAFAVSASWPATVEATSDVRAYLVPPRFVVEPCAQPCLARHNDLTANMLRIVSEKALNLNRKVNYLLLRGMREKLATFLLEAQHRAGKSTFELPMNRDSLAEYLHVSRPSMSRELGRMRDEGLIAFYRSSVRILDPERLRAGGRS
jgi:CRP/FNR family transcriptional regulator, dissimilatory nitrate respiration regulator